MEDNFYRLATLVEELGGDVCREVVSRLVSHAGKSSLEEFLSQTIYYHTLYHLWKPSVDCCLSICAYKGKTTNRLIYDTQWSKLYSKILGPRCINSKTTPKFCPCQFVANSGADVKFLDVSLACTILLNITVIPAMLTVTEREALKLIRQCRNTLAHLTDHEIGIGEFNDMWSKLDSALCTLASLSSIKFKTAIIERITDLKTRCLDSLYRNLILSSLRDNEQLSKIQEEISRQRMELRDANETVQNLEKNMKVVTENQQDVKSSTDRLKGEVSSLGRKMEMVTCNQRKCFSLLRSQAEKRTGRVFRRSRSKKTRRLEENSLRNRILSQTRLEIEKHMSDETYCYTSAVGKGFGILKKFGMLMISGTIGSGKSTTAKEIIKLALEEKLFGEDVDILKLGSICQWQDVVNAKRNTIVFVDDFLGTSHMDSRRTDDLLRLQDTILACIEKGNVRIISTIRLNVLAACKRYHCNLKIMNKLPVLDISRHQKLTFAEKKAILKAHCLKHNVQFKDGKRFKRIVIADDNCESKTTISVRDICKKNPVLGFPHTCSLFCSSTRFQALGTKFFEQPSDILVLTLENMVGSENQMELVQYLVLVYMVLNNGRIDLEDIDEILIKRIAANLRLDTIPSIFTMKKCIIQMLDFYVKSCRNVSDIYLVTYESITEAVVLSYGKYHQEDVVNECKRNILYGLVRTKGCIRPKNPLALVVRQKCYRALSIRLIEELREGKAREVVSHPCMDDEEFLRVFFATVKSEDQSFHIICQEDQFVKSFLHMCCKYYKYIAIKCMLETLFGLSCTIHRLQDVDQCFEIDLNYGSTVSLPSFQGSYREASIKTLSKTDGPSIVSWIKYSGSDLLSVNTNFQHLISNNPNNNAVLLSLDISEESYDRLSQTCHFFLSSVNRFSIVDPVVKILRSMSIQQFGKKVSRHYHDVENICYDKIKGLQLHGPKNRQTIDYLKTKASTHQQIRIGLFLEHGSCFDRKNLDGARFCQITVYPREKDATDQQISTRRYVQQEKSAIVAYFLKLRTSIRLDTIELEMEHSLTNVSYPTFNLIELLDCGPTRT